MSEFRMPLDWNEEQFPSEGLENDANISPLADSFAKGMWQSLESRLLDFYSQLVVDRINTQDDESSNLETVLHNIAKEIDSQVVTTHLPVTEEMERHLGSLLATYMFNDTGDAIQYSARINAWIDLAKQLYFSRVHTALFVAKVRDRIRYH